MVKYNPYRWIYTGNYPRMPKCKAWDTAGRKCQRTAKEGLKWCFEHKYADTRGEIPYKETEKYKIYIRNRVNRFSKVTKPDTI